jgi:hypothetical protein
VKLIAELHRDSSQREPGTDSVDDLSHSVLEQYARNQELYEHICVRVGFSDIDHTVRIHSKMPERVKNMFTSFSLLFDERAILTSIQCSTGLLQEMRNLTTIRSITTTERRSLNAGADFFGEI